MVMIDMPMNYQEALGLVRRLIDLHIPINEAVANPVIPEAFRGYIREQLEREEVFVLEPPRTIVAEDGRGGWLRYADRSDWYYWPTLRRFLLDEKGWSISVVRSLDSVTDFILGQLAPPYTDDFDIRGLVVGYVQSGKTANYTALIAKAADVGYRLIIVLSGIDNGLRRQTQLRLKRELVGYADRRPGSVPLPPRGKWWHEFTREDINGDFRPGFANYAALQGSQPVLLVIKKNSAVLRRLLNWLHDAPDEVRYTIPLLVIDDEADQASVDIRGAYQQDGDTPPNGENEDPSAINGLIRRLLQEFHRSAYVAYTATPFANILIPHDAFMDGYQNDLYPKDFIIDLPKPPGYFGAEELFGISDSHRDSEVTGMNVIRDIPDEDLEDLDQNRLPVSLDRALKDFVLAGATRAHRGHGNRPATMLVHISRLIFEQRILTEMIEQHFKVLRDEWRYQRDQGIREGLRQQWETEFRPQISESHDELDTSFEDIEPHIGPFFESVRIRTINSDTGHVLDYETEPDLKAIVVGGNRLSRGLTLEGLLVSYFARQSIMYDTLMQMGRWFGFREGYEDLTRIYTTRELANWFSNLAFVEHQFREDLQIYERLGMTPLQVGMRIWVHPSMQVTSRLKKRFAREFTSIDSYAGTRAQTFRFPFDQPEALAVQQDTNLQAVKDLLSQIGTPQWDENGPIWSEVPSGNILHFLSKFQTMDNSGIFNLELISRYIERQSSQGELVNWTVAVRGLRSLNPELGEADWGVPGGHIWQINRSKFCNRDSLGVITNRGDEATGLSPEEMVKKNRFVDEGMGEDVAARFARSVEKGLLLLYPISKYSRPTWQPAQGTDRQNKDAREELYTNPEDPRARDLIGVAISFPLSRLPQPVAEYIVGTVPWGRE
jgi:hypothetical protein